MTADLHIHSTASDGMMDPEKVVNVAHSLGLATIALTDHDSTKGIAAARETASNLEITVINGVEITACFENREVHLLGYAFNLQNEKLSNCLRDHKKARTERAKAIIERLKQAGIRLTIDEVRAEATSPNICRPHIASVLVSKGYVATSREAFFRYLSDEALGAIKNFYHPLRKTVEFIKEAGGVAVLAHPGRLYSERELKKMTAAGIDGIETVHPAHSFKIQKKLNQYAEENNLLTTGGSDFHGKSEKYYQYFGTLGIDEQKIQKIARLARHRKKAGQIE